MRNILSCISPIYGKEIKTWIKYHIYTGMAKDNYTQLLMTQDDMYTYIDEMLDADKQRVEILRLQLKAA